MEIFFRCVTGHPTSEIHCFINSSDGRVIGRSQFNELVTARQATQELAFVPIWSNECKSGDKHASRLIQNGFYQAATSIQLDP